MPKAKKITKLSTDAKDVNCKTSRKLPAWVDLGSRGLFEDEVGTANQQDAVSWLASWKPVISPLHLSYIKKMGDHEEEYVCKSKNWVAAKTKPYPKMRCTICRYQRFFLCFKTMLTLSVSIGRGSSFHAM